MACQQTLTADLTTQVLSHAKIFTCAEVRNVRRGVVSCLHHPSLTRESPLHASETPCNLGLKKKAVHPSSGKAISFWKKNVRRELGNAKLLTHKITGKILLVLRRQEKTLQNGGNFIVVRRFRTARPCVVIDESWVWMALDQSDVEQKVER